MRTRNTIKLAILFELFDFSYTHVIRELLSWLQHSEYLTKVVVSPRWSKCNDGWAECIKTRTLPFDILAGS